MTSVYLPFKKCLLFLQNGNRLRTTLLLLIIFIFGLTLFLSYESEAFLPLYKILKNADMKHNLSQDFLDKTKKLKYGNCTPHIPSEDAIKMVERVYKLDPSLTSCKPPVGDNICGFKVKSIANETMYDFQVKCNPVCTEHNKSRNLEVFTVRSGKITSAGTYQTIGDLEKGVLGVVKDNIKRKIHFVVIRCTSNKPKPVSISQILPIDPRLTIKKNVTRSRDKNVINVNILLSDSVSRAHFYRSLPKTVELFKDWTSNPGTAPARVFDFELFQAVEGHTTENTHALFNGRLLPLDRTGSHSVQPGTLFGAFKKAGFQTMWQEDLCWKAVWGLKMDLEASNWDHLQQRLQENFIDHAGLTDSSCEVLEYVYKTTHPFYNPIQICYGGRYQHEFFFNYTLNTLKAISSDPDALPLVSYMASNVGHDHTGRRIQSHDLTLLEYVKELSLLEDTITILLADHGNTYTRYTVDIIEGRFEIYHPHLFMIIPNKVANRLGQEALYALDINQQRLFTVIELHQSIMALRHPLTGRVQPRGLFAPISANRTCNDIELRRPNLCVCEGWDTPVKNDDMKLALVEYAVGMLNDKLDKQLIEGSKGSERTLYPRSCLRLRAVGYNDVRERRDSTFLYTSMLILVGAANLKEKETFNVEVQSRDADSRRSLDIKLNHFDRLSRYGSYGACADKGVSLKLCTCSSAPKEQNQTSDRLNVTQLMAPSGREYLGSQTITPLKVGKQGCLYLITRSHKKISYAYELANVCHRQVFKVKIDVRSNDVELSLEGPFIVDVPIGIRFIFSARVTKVGLKDKAVIEVNVTLAAGRKKK